jgi:hypothetical protein
MSSWNIFNSQNETETLQPDNDKILALKFYTNLFQDFNTDSNINTMFEKHTILFKKLLNISNEYTLKTKEEKVNSIYYKNIPLDTSADNLLFMKYIKFHSGFLKFNEWYRPNNFDKIEIDEQILNDYIAKQFYVCLEKNKRHLKDKVKELSDFQLISNICVKERLTFFNFLMDKGTQRKLARNFINMEYIRLFRDSNYLPNLSREIKNIELSNILQVYSK